MLSTYCQAGGLTEPPKVETPADSTIRSAADEAFDQIDTNGDGVITRNEWIAAMNPSSPHDNASVATTPAVPQAAPQAAPESVRQVGVSTLLGICLTIA